MRRPLASRGSCCIQQRQSQWCCWSEGLYRCPVRYRGVPSPSAPPADGAAQPIRPPQPCEGGHKQCWRPRQQ
eukprot:5557098-Lingulodinium_polyedra.AAC.1